MNKNLLRGAVMPHYVTCALWSTGYCGDLPGDEAPELLDDIAEPEDCAPELLRQFRGECAAFLWDARALLRPFVARDGLARTLERVGHDLWLTAQGHGAGFWDGDWQIPAGDLRGEPNQDIDHSHALSELASVHGYSGDLYHVGDYNGGTVHA